MAADETAKKVKTTGQNKFIKFFRELKGEFRKMTWPSKEKVKEASIAALVFIAIWVLVVGVMDFGFERLLKLILNI